MTIHEQQSTNYFSKCLWKCLLRARTVFHVYLWQIIVTFTTHALLITQFFFDYVSKEIYRYQNS